ncbi:MAG: TIGR03621 family F420-dependent LLM class oxidoreductase [Actinomycetota bacterium]
MSDRTYRFGFQETASADRDGIRANARAAEAAGFHEYWSSDHIGAADPFLPLQYAADATTSLRVGPLTLNNEFHHPVMIARAAATLDRLTGGRAVIGLGTGYAQGEHDAAAITLRPPGERVTRFGETLHVVRSLLDDGACTFDGQHHHIALDALGVEPVQSRLPLLVGGNGRRVVTLAGRHTDIFQFTGVTFLPDGPDVSGMAMSELVKRRDWLVEAAGDRIDDIERSALVQRLEVTDDPGAVRDEIAERWGMEPDQIDECPFALLGSIEQIVDKIERLRSSLGITHYVVRDTEAFAPIIDRLR